MFSFLHKKNSKKNSNLEQKPSLSKHKGAVCSSSTLEAVDLANVNTKINDNKFNGSNSGFFTVLRKHNKHNNIINSIDTDTDSSINLNKDNITPKGSFSRKTNISLASFNTGYFTTGRCNDRKKSLGLCYLTFGPETKRTLLPSQVTGIDTVKALFVRAFPDKLTMNYLDDETNVKIYIKDQLKDLFYQLDDMNDIKDKCVLKLVELNQTSSLNMNSQISLTNNALNPNYTQINNSFDKVAQQRLSKQSNILNDYYSSNTHNGQNRIMDLGNQYNYNNLDQQQESIINEQNMTSTANYAPVTNPRSLSEPRHHNNLIQPQLPPPPLVPNYVHHHQQQQQQQQQQQVINANRKSQVNFQTPIDSNHNHYIIQQSYFNPQQIPSQNSTTLSSVETYDNLNDNQMNNHQSRIDNNNNNNNNNRYEQNNYNQSQFNHFNRYNSSLKPKYNSMRVPSSSNNKTSETYDSNTNNLLIRNTPSNVMMGIKQLNRKSCINPTTTTFNHANLRDIKSCEREFLVSNDLSHTTSVNINNQNNNSSTCTTILPVSSVTHHRERSRSGSITPHQIYDTEDDDVTTASGSICFNGKNDAKTNNLNRYIDSKNEHSDFLENDPTKTKLKLMENQLQTLLNMVNKALISRDINQLAADFNLTCKYLNEKQNDKRKNGSTKRSEVNNIKELNEKTKSLRKELNSIKKLQENFNCTFGDSMKSFVNQLNEKLKSFCLGEINEKIKFDLILMKYHNDSSKIENELSDLETVVDDLRVNILKHKSNISIDDIECYALALSQLSKQLVGLKSSFSEIKDQLKVNATSNDAKYLRNESAKLDLIIRRCKRITGILIIFKKLSALPKKASLQSNKYTQNLSKKQINLNPQSPKFKPSPANNELVIWENKTCDIDTEKSITNRHSNQVNKDLLRQIESIEPDYEQRKLAIEVDDAFNQLMSEILTITNDINSINKIEDSTSIMSLLNQINSNEKILINKNSLNKSQSGSLIIESDKKQEENDNNDNLETYKHENESTLKKRNKFRLQKESLKCDDNMYENKQNESNNVLLDPSPPSSTSATCSSSSPALSSTSSSPSSSSPTPESPSPSNNTDFTNQYINNQQQSISFVKTNLIERPFLETVHEEELVNSNENHEINNNEKLAKTSISIQPTILMNQINEKKEHVSNIENELYEQLNQLKPLRSKYFKTTTSICLNRDPVIISDNQSSESINLPNQINSITIIPTNELNNKSLFKSPSTSLNSTIVSYSSLTNSTYNGLNNNKFNNNKLAVRFSDTTTTIFGNNSKDEISNNESLILSNKISENVNGASESLSIINTNSANPIASTTSLELNETDKMVKPLTNQITRRNSSLIPYTNINPSPTLECLAQENNKILSQNLVSASVQRRVSLSVTDL